MDGEHNKSSSLETLVLQNTSNTTELKNKLTHVINIGKDYDENIVSSLIILLGSNDSELLSLAVQTVAELSKCEKKRLSYAQKNIISSILDILKRDIIIEKVELVKHCCRALGNLCCDCDKGREIILECDGVKVLMEVLKKSVDNDNGLSAELAEIRLYICKCLMNFTLGGTATCKPAIEAGLVDYLYKVLKCEMTAEDMNDDIVLTALLVLSVINENTPDMQFDNDINRMVLNVLKETSNIEISEICLDHLHMQAENDALKTVLAREGAVQLLCSRLELLISKRASGDISADDSEVKAIMKQACDLLIIILTGDDAMNHLYNNGIGESYITMIKWLDSTDYDLLTTAVLAIGNFARSDTCCIQMMEENIFDKLLKIFETYHGFCMRMTNDPSTVHPIDEATVTRVQHAVLSALRNLAVPVANKRVAAANGKAAPILLKALPRVTDHHVAYKLLAAIRMLVDGQEGVAKQFAGDEAALAATVSWGQKVEHAGAAGEAPRLIAWTIKQLRNSTQWQNIIKVNGCTACLVNMLVSSHSVMQNEAILALTLLSIETMSRSSQDKQYEDSFTEQLIESEIGKHVSVLIETNCAKIPVEVAENLLAFLDITVKKEKLASEYVEAKVFESLKKFAESRNDCGDDIRSCIAGISALMSDN